MNNLDMLNSEPQTRVLNTRLELREAESGDGLTLTGIAVPFNQRYDLYDDVSETFDPDCDFGTRTVKVAREHGELIGRAIELEARDDGLHITARLSDTAAGRETAQLVRDGVYDAFSVGFKPVSHTIEQTEGRTLIHRREVELVEVSVTGIPAYPGAAIESQRTLTSTNDKEQIMDTEENTTMAGQIAALDSEVRDIKTMLARDTGTAAAPTGAQYRSAGDYLKALAAGEEQAVTLMRDSTNLITTAQAGDNVTWIADQLKLIEQRRKVTNLLSHAALPASGMSLEYNVITSQAMKVGEQAAEGDALQFGKVEFGTKSAPVKTYGGYTKLSRQVIERSTVPMLNTALRALLLEYAKATENAVRTALYAQITAAMATNKLTAAKTLAAMTPNDWVKVIMDAAEAADTNNVALGTLAVAKDVALAIASLTDTGSRFLDISGKGNDTLGSFDVTGIVGNLLRVPVQILPNAAAGTAAFIDPSAITVWESGGPTQLTDGDPITLTEAYSVYGYMAVGVTEPNGIQPIEFAAK
ncbi:phage capsid protein [Bifidobacterium pseudolongum subsp. globosum]|uniref:Phage capsid protein n=2 Tax=Bifidobacterium pseudolongum TaxID=1694 RepID=A0A4Q5BB00_9BIFI|nr:phage capsid protein [Bifidobacterium pseudolongum subsp. globosum]